MIDITMHCSVNERAGLWISPDDEGHLRFGSFNGRGDILCLWFSPDDIRRLYEALGAHLGTTPPVKEPTMKKLSLPCAMNKEDTLIFEETVLRGNEGQLVVFAEEDGELSRICLSAESEDRLYQFLSERRGITPAEPEALTRIAVASERAAVALEKLASYATDDPLADSARIP